MPHSRCSALHGVNANLKKTKTDSQPHKCALDMSIPIYMTIYLDTLAAVKYLSLGFQQDIHNLVKAVRRIQEFLHGVWLN